MPRRLIVGSFNNLNYRPGRLRYSANDSGFYPLRCPGVPRTPGKHPDLLLASRPAIALLPRQTKLVAALGAHVGRDPYALATVTLPAPT